MLGVNSKVCSYYRQAYPWSHRTIQGFLDAKRATNICITLCIKGSLRSCWLVEMTDPEAYL